MRQRTVGRFQHLQQMLRDELLDFAGVGQLLAVGALADALQNLGGSVDADVGGDQRVLQLLQHVRVDFLAAREGVLQTVHQARTRLLDACFQAFQQVGFLLNGAE